MDAVVPSRDLGVNFYQRNFLYSFIFFFLLSLLNRWIKSDKGRGKWRSLENFMIKNWTLPGIMDHGQSWSSFGRPNTARKVGGPWGEEEWMKLKKKTLKISYIEKKNSAFLGTCYTWGESSKRNSHWYISFATFQIHCWLFQFYNPGRSFFF